MVTINPTNDLAVSTTYTVTVPANAFESSDDQTDAGQFILPFSSAAAPDTTPPMVSLSVPASGGTINALDDIVLTFSETVQRGTGNILITIVGITTVAISVTDTSQVSILGNVVTLSSIVGSAGEYEMIVPAGSFVDLAGNASARFMLSFTANAPAETTPPTISSIAPAQNATNVALDSDIVVFYSEFVQSGTGNITITPMGGTPITIAVGDAQVSILGIVVTINPTADFEPNTVYTVSIPAGAITDGAATPNPAALYTLTFTTAAAIIAPRVISSVPAEGVLIMDRGNERIVLTFSEVVVKGTGIIRLNISSGFDEFTLDVATSPLVTISGGGTVVTIDISSSGLLDFGNRPYALTVPATAFVDEDGNNLARDYTLGFMIRRN